MLLLHRRPPRADDDPGRRAVLRENVRAVALDYLALGLDPEQTAFFRQSDIPEVTELAWILSTVTGMGLLERAHSYKDKLARGIAASRRPLHVPDADGRRHPDLQVAPRARRPGPGAARRDDPRHGRATSTRPTGRSSPCPRRASTARPTVPGTDGKKMSKSYGNTIEIFAEGKALQSAVMRIVTDSTPVEAPKDPGQGQRVRPVRALRDEDAKEDLAAAAIAPGGSATATRRRC